MSLFWCVCAEVQGLIFEGFWTSASLGFLAVVGVKPGITVLCFLGKCRCVSDRSTMPWNLERPCPVLVNVCSETQGFGSCFYHVLFMFQIQEESCKGLSEPILLKVWSMCTYQDPDCTWVHCYCSTLWIAQYCVRAIEWVNRNCPALLSLPATFLTTRVHISQKDAFVAISKNGC